MSWGQPQVESKGAIPGRGETYMEVVKMLKNHSPYMEGEVAEF
jgi:hypothetical protein